MVFDRFVDEHLRLEHPEVWAEVERLREELAGYVIERNKEIKRLRNELRKANDKLSARQQVSDPAYFEALKQEVERLTKDNMRMATENRFYNDAIEAQDALQVEVDRLQKQHDLLMASKPRHVAELYREVERLRAMLESDGKRGLSQALDDALAEVERLRSANEKNKAYILELEASPAIGTTGSFPCSCVTCSSR